MAQGSEFPLRKPPGFHWDFFLLGVTTFISGLLGIPAPNGLIPQAPIHTTSLVVTERKRDEISEKNPDLDPVWREEPVAVVEQRVSNLAQGSLCLVLLTGPFLHVLNLIPRGMCLLNAACDSANVSYRCIGWLVVSISIFLRLRPAS